MRAFKYYLCAVVVACFALCARCATHGARPKLAVVMPTTNTQMDRIRYNFDQWRTHTPCTTLTFGVDATFVFQVNTRFEPHVRRELEELWNATAYGRRCFTGGALFEEAALTPEQDQPRVEGTCWQHYRTFSRMVELGFDHWLQFESDVLPVRSKWLTRVAEEMVDNSDCQRFWVRGPAPAYGPSHKSDGPRIDGHLINGNALYCLNDDTLDYTRRVVAEFPPSGCTVPRAYERDGMRGLVGFDWVSYLYRTSMRAQQYMTGRSHAFQVASWIADYGCCTTASQVSEAVRRREDVHLMHTKVFF